MKMGVISIQQDFVLSVLICYTLIGKERKKKKGGQNEKSDSENFGFVAYYGLCITTCPVYALSEDPREEVTAANPQILYELE